VAGASEKSVLYVDNDRFIIITGLTFFSGVNSSTNINLTQVQLQSILDRNTQVKIFSDKSLNNFIFRNHLNITEVRVSTADLRFSVAPGSATRLDTYLIHDSSVSFSFSYALRVTDSLRAITPAESVGYPVPIDYGKSGQDAINVRLIGTTPDAVTPSRIFSGGPFVNNGTGNGSEEFVYPVDNNTRVPVGNLERASNYPLLLVDYVEIIGNPTNISATL